MVRAKFKVEVREETVNGISVDLTPVTSGSEENKEFFKWTPGGAIRLSTINFSAAEVFVPGKEFYVDFTLAQ